MNTCRTCLQTPAENNISELEKGVDEENINCLDIMLFCLDIKVAQDSRITKNLCNNCYSKIISFYKFKTLSLKNDEYLKSLNPTVQLVDQKLSIYADENGIRHVNILDPNYSSDIKVEVDFTNEDTSGNVGSDEESLSEGQKFKYEFIEEEIHENAICKTHPSPKKGTGPKKAKSADVKQGRQICAECGESVLNLKEHSLRHQPMEERQMLQCKACPMLFYSKSGRRKHYKITHLGIKSKCDICNKEVVHLSVHKLQKHNMAAAPYGCANCPRRFVAKSLLDTHMISHTQHRAFECDICHKKFGKKIDISRHIRQVHQNERNHQCEFCSKTFFVRATLLEHFETHKADHVYKCSECGKSFATKMSYRKHIQIHRNRAVRCDLCGKSFKCASYLKAHMVSHTKEKRFACRFCGACFGRSSSRRRHEDTLHQHLAHAAHPLSTTQYGSISAGGDAGGPTTSNNTKLE